MKIENYKLKINKKGFTLVELLVYTGIFAVVSGLMIGILTTTLRVNQRESASAEATSQLNFVLQTIQRLTRESSAIIVNSSSTNMDTDDTIGSQQTRLVLRMKDSSETNSSARDPIVIYAEDNIIKMSEGRGGYQRVSDLTNSRVLADNLKFTKYTQYPGHDTVGVDIQLTYNSQDPSSRATRNLRTAIARVSAATFDSNLLPGEDNTYEIGYFAGNQRWKNIFISNLISTSNLLNLGRLSSDPSTDVQNGSMYYNTASSTFRGYKANAWSNLGEGLWTASSTDIYYNTGNVGIGTTAPGAKLDIYGATPYLRISDSTSKDTWAFGDTFGLLDFWSGDSYNTGPRVGAYVRAQHLRAGSGHSAADIGLAFGISGPNSSPAFVTAYTAMVIDNNGNVGIGTTTPSQKLTVAGTIESTSGGIKFPDGTTQTTSAGVVSSRKICLENEYCSGTPKICAYFRNTSGVVSADDYSVSFGSWSNSQCGLSGSGWHVDNINSCGTGSGLKQLPCAFVIVE